MTTATVHLRDDDGALIFSEHDARVPVTLTVSPRWAPPSSLPPGPKVSFGRTEAVVDLPTAAELNAIADHVHGWTGVTDHGVPVECSRSMVRAICIASAHYLAEFRRAIRLVSSSGVL